MRLPPSADQFQRRLVVRHTFEGEPALRSLGACLRRQEGGFATLMSVIIVGAIGSALAVSLLFSGVSSAKTTIVVEQSFEAAAAAHACAEAALQKIHDNLNYSGVSALTIGGVPCSVTVTVGSGQNRTVAATATLGEAVRKVSITISAITPSITISSWQEVADF